MIEKKKKKKKHTIDHWGFLEEIEAPMWVDLSVESKYMYQDIDDHWFQVTHQFHEHSSSYLISGLSNSSEDKVLSDVDLLGPSSPKLPSSVSRSRGKHFKSRKCRGDEQQRIRKLNGETQQKISALGVKSKVRFEDSKCGSRILKTGLVGDETSTTNTRPNSIQIKCRLQNPRHTSSWRPSLVGKSSSNETMKSSSIGESSLTSNSGPDSFGENCGSVHLRNSSTKLLNSIRNKSSFGDSSSSLSQGATIVGESFLNSKVNNVAESSQQEIKTIDPPRELLSALRISLPKRCVTRQPSRVEVKDKRDLKSFKSSFGKSSVGFYSNSGCNIKNSLVTSGMNQSRNNEDKNLIKMDKTTKQNDRKSRNASKTSSISQKELISRSKPEGKITNVKCVDQETTKTKVLHHFESRKPTLQHKVQDPSIVQSRAKGSVINTNQGKARGCTVSSQNAGGKENNIESIGWSQKALKQRSEVKNEKGLSNLKAKTNGRSKLENPKRMVERIYFR